MTLGAGAWAGVTGLALLGVAMGPQKRAVPADDFSWVRGANYVPSYARNDVQTWMDFDADVIDRDLGYAAKLKLNMVRVFLQPAVYEKDPRLFLQRFETLAGLCARHKLLLMPVLFDSCFGAYPDLEGYRDKDWMAAPGQNRLGPEHRAAMAKYVKDVVGKYRTDPRIAMWDVMNEPTCTSFKAPEDVRLIYDFLGWAVAEVRARRPRQPLTIGHMHLEEATPELMRAVDVISFHNYNPGPVLTKVIRQGQELGRQYGKPVMINEVAGRPHQPFEMVMDVVRREKIGWMFWELMQAKTQFARGTPPYQGLIDPDGTCYDPSEVAAVMDVPVAEAVKVFPPRPMPPPVEEGMKFTGRWTRWAGPGPAKGRVFFSRTPGDRLAMLVEGAAVDVIFKASAVNGIARVLVEGQEVARVDTYAAKDDWGKRVRVLEGGAHVPLWVEVEVTGEQNPEAENRYVQVIGIEAHPEPPAGQE